MDSRNGLDIVDRGRWRKLARLARILARPWLDRRQNLALRERIDAVPADTPEDVRERRRKLARDPNTRPRD